MKESPEQGEEEGVSGVNSGNRSAIAWVAAAVLGTDGGSVYPGGKCSNSDGQTHALSSPLPAPVKSYISENLSPTIPLDGTESASIFVFAPVD